MIATERKIRNTMKNRTKQYIHLINSKENFYEIFGKIFIETA